MSHDFLKSIFSDFTLQVRLFFVAKGNVLAFKNVMERGMRKILTFVNRGKLHLNFSG